MIRTFLILAALAMPVSAFAAGGDSSPPKDTKTKTCWGKRVYDEAKGRCVKPEQSSLNQDQLMDAVREKAYAGRYDDAIGVLDVMTDQQGDMVLTYRGFTARKLGNLELANMYYQQAIDANPDNILARSYMAQGMVEAGDKLAAMMQLREIRARGGSGTWAEQSLASALETGKGYNY